MTNKALDVYLNDHLSGATLGADLARQIQSRNRGTPLGEAMQAVAPQVEEDRRTLIALMDRLGTSTNPLKQAGAWVTEKTTRVKFSGVISKNRGIGELMALETMALGVQGKLGLWNALQQVSDQHPEIAELDLDTLAARARSQYQTLEQQRLAVADRTLSHGKDAV